MPITNSLAELKNTMKLTDEEMSNAFAISKDAMLWRAIMQVLVEYREQSIDAAAGHIATEKPLCAAGSIGASEVLKTVITDFESLREAATKD